MICNHLDSHLHTYSSCSANSCKIPRADIRKNRTNSNPSKTIGTTIQKSYHTRLSWRELWGKNENPFQSAYQGDFFNTLLYWLILTRRHNSLVTFSILRSLYSGCSPTPANLFALVSVPNYWLMQPEVLLQCNLINIVGSTMWSTLATHLPSLCLSGLFPLSDPWD